MNQFRFNSYKEMKKHKANFEAQGFVCLWTKETNKNVWVLSVYPQSKLN